MLNKKTLAHLLLIIVTISSIACASQKAPTATDDKTVTARAGEAGREQAAQSAAANKSPVVPIKKSSPPQNALQDEYFNHIKFSYAAALKRWLAAKPGIRPAQISDYDDQKNNPLPNDASRHPYYAEGDFNNDGNPEYAVVLIDAKRKRSLAIFNAAPNDGDSPDPIFTSAELADYDTLSFNEEYKILIVAPIQSDNGFYLKPSGKSYKAEALSEL